MDKRELELRTKRFALLVIRFVKQLNTTHTGRTIGSQILRSGTSIGANYREANRAESRRDFIHKIGLVEKEAAETQYWLELASDSALGSESDRSLLLRESTELLAIFTAIGRNSKRR